MQVYCWCEFGGRWRRADVQIDPAGCDRRVVQHELQRAYALLPRRHLPVRHHPDAPARPDPRAGPDSGRPDSTPSDPGRPFAAARPNPGPGADPVPFWGGRGPRSGS